MRMLSLLSASLCLSNALAVTLADRLSIVRPDGCDSRIEYAHMRFAEELRLILGESGIDAQVVKESEFREAAPAIRLGASAALRVGFDLSGLRNWDNVYAEKDGSVYLFGNDRNINQTAKPWDLRGCQLPSLRATVRFLHDCLGVRFVMPGRNGTEVSRKAPFEIPAGLFNLERTTQDSGSGTGTPEEWPYLFFGGEFPMGAYHTYGGHSYPVAVPVLSLFESHPEYFAEKEGKRRIHPQDPTFTGLCISNPEVERLIVEELLKRFDAGAEICELGQQDAAETCDCAKCRALYGTGDDWCEKFWIFHRLIAERILKERPGKKVLITSYERTLEPPKSFTKFPSNVMIELCDTSERSFAKWKGYDVPGGFSAYVYFWGDYLRLGLLPKHSFAGCAAFAKRMVENGVRRVHRCGYRNLPGIEGIQYYVFNAVLMDPKADVPSVVREFCEGAYGGASAHMRRFYEELDARLCACDSIDEAGGECLLRESGLPKDPLDLAGYVFSPETIRRMDAALAQAESIPGLTVKQRRRLRRVRVEYDYARNLGRIASLYATYRSEPTPDVAESLAKELCFRNRMVDSFYDKAGKARTQKDWPGRPYFHGTTKAMLLENGRLNARIGDPLSWDVERVLQTERPLLTVGLMSDTHIQDSTESCARAGKAFEVFRDNGVGLIAHVGDLADRFSADGYAAYRKWLDEVFAGSKRRPREAYVFAAHDAFSFPDSSRRHAADYVQAQEAFAAVKQSLGIQHGMEDVLEVGGFPFVVCSQWLPAADYGRMLEKVMADYPKGPVFVLDHLPPFATVSDSFFYGSEERRRILDLYPRVIHISGHNHASIRDEGSFWQGGFSAVNCGCLSYLGCNGNAIGGVVKGSQWDRVESSDAMTMEVYADRVVFRRWDVCTGREIGATSPWVIRLPHVVVDPKTSFKNRGKGEIAPEFPEDALLSIADAGKGDIALSFPETALSRTRWYEVELERRCGDGTWTKYARQDFPGGCIRASEDRNGVAERILSGALFMPDIEHRITVTPIGQFGTPGRSIVKAFVPPAASEWRSILTAGCAGEGWRVTGNVWAWRTGPAIPPDTKDGWYVSADSRRYWAVEPLPAETVQKGSRYAIVVDAELDGGSGLPFHIALDSPYGASAISKCGCVPRQSYCFEFTAREDGERHAIAFCSLGPARFRPLSVRVVQYVGKGPQGKVRTEDLRVRDPFILADRETGTYRLYSSRPWYGGDGVDAYESKDLQSWSGPTRVMQVDKDARCCMLWAPEVHSYRGKWYLLVTQTEDGDRALSPMLKKGFQGGTARPRGVWAYVADSPRGPFRPTRKGSLTPEEWSCLDGTFFEQEGRPYLVFCHEWCQTGDGRMMVAELADDFSCMVGEPQELFTATSAGKEHVVTDGPFLYRSAISKRLFMLWSNSGPEGYAVYLKKSASGSVKGPWEDNRTLFGRDGGHGMLFRKFDGELVMALHRPNRVPDERMCLLPIVDDGRTLREGRCR